MAEAVDGFTFTPPAGDYSIVFRAEPTPHEQAVPLPDGSSLPFTLYVVDSAETAFGTGALVFPPGTHVPLEVFRDGAIANVSDL